MNKHYITTLCEVDGEMEYESTFIFTLPHFATEEIALDILILGYRGEGFYSYDIENDEYISSAGMTIYESSSEEIPAEDFEVLKKYLPDLSNKI